MPKTYHLHLISDATGETTHSIARACLVQFEGVEATEHMWPMVRTEAQLKRVFAGIETHPGAVIYTLMNEKLSALLKRECRRLKVPCISVLGGIMNGLSKYFGAQIRGQPGRQHLLDEEYFLRIEAINYVMGHDDGQGTPDLEDAQVVLVGVSRTSKTPTSIYLANHRGIKTANVPYVPGMCLPPELFETNGPLIIGLTASPDRLIQMRRNRILMLGQEPKTDYVDPERVKEEIAQARKLFSKMKWPVIDVTRRSIEETAAAIMQRYTAHLESAEEDADLFGPGADG